MRVGWLRLVHFLVSPLSLSLFVFTRRADTDSTTVFIDPDERGGSRCMDGTALLKASLALMPRVWVAR